MSDLSDADLEKIDKELMDSVDLQNPNATVTLLRQRLKNPEQRKAWREWSAKRDKTEKETMPIMEPAQYVQALASADFSTDKVIWDICALLEKPAQPFSRLGYHAGHMYRLRPNPRVLVSSAPCSEEETRPLLPDHILGISMNEVALNNNTGFIFLQLGDLMYTEKKFWNTNMSPVDMVWNGSGYAVVAAIGSNQLIGPIYIIYNFQPRDKIDGERYTISDDVQWGLLPGDPVKRAGARIAASLGQLTNLTANDEWTFSEVFCHQPELVDAVWTSQKTIIRRTMFNENKT